jgi:hypothetical protein
MVLLILQIIIIHNIFTSNYMILYVVVLVPSPGFQIQPRRVACYALGLWITSGPKLSGPYLFLLTLY